MSAVRPGGRPPTNRDIIRQIEALVEAVDTLASSAGVTAAAVTAIKDKLGDEPNSDGSGGKGLIGDLRKTSRDVGALMDLRRTALGFIAAVTLFGALIVLGATKWIEGIVTGAKA